MSDYISQDLLLLILKRLPVKTLLQCRCVCKSWKQLISSKSLTLDHLAVQNRRILIQNRDLTYLLFDPKTLPLFDDTLKTPITLESYRSFHFSSIHGVICVYDNANTLFLSNPSIRQHLAIPLPDLSIFHSKGYNYCGFWIDPSNNDYKVVVFRLKTKRSVLYSSKDQTWTEFDMGIIRDDYEYDCESPQVTVDGVAHWTVIEWNGYETADIVSFDFAQHKFGIIDLPDKYSLRNEKYLCKWKDLLSVGHCENRWPDRSCYIWLMRNGSWSFMLSLTIHNYISRLFFVVENSDKVLASNATDDLVLYDYEHGFIDLPTRFGISGVYYISYDFVESLVFPSRNLISSY